jgi:hypothetical protein
VLEAGLEFDEDLEAVVAAFLRLPEVLRPMQFSSDEDTADAADRVDDTNRLTNFLKRGRSGFFLLGPGVTYSIRIADGKNIVCDCFLDIGSERTIQFMEHMSKAKAIFGFACVPDEREEKNRISIQQGSNAIQSWVGRDTERYLPGFYWLTLLPEPLATRHSIPLSKVKAVAKEEYDLESGQRLFRFYDHPEDWQKTPAVDELSRSLPGVFDIEKVRHQLSSANGFLEVSSMLRNWR